MTNFLETKSEWSDRVSDCECIVRVDVASIDHSFDAGEMRDFVSLLGLPITSDRTADDLACILVEQFDEKFIPMGKIWEKIRIIVI